MPCGRRVCLENTENSFFKDSRREQLFKVNLSYVADAVFYRAKQLRPRGPFCHALTKRIADSENEI